jgi:DNA-binding CsgD family transcriptional regulator/predicted ATPase
MSDDGQQTGSPYWQSSYALPVTTLPFIGRDDLLEKALDALGAGTRLLTFTGPAGVGKTRLAVEVARRFAAGERRTAFLRLSPLRDSAALPGLIASVCAVDGWPDLPIARMPVHLHTVLVLDGFDHMQDAGATIAALLERCPNLVAIVTSRTPPQLPGELSLPVDPLSTELRPDRQSDAAAFLLARIGLSDERTSGAEHASIATGGNPLALELIAACLRAGIVPPSYDRADNGRSPAETIEKCIQALPVEAQILLRRIAVMAAGFADDAVSALAIVSPAVLGDALAHLQRFVRLGLVSSRMVHGGTTRYEMPTAVREVALTQLSDSGELAVIRLTYARHLLERAIEQRERLFGRQRDAALAWFEIEQAGLRLAFGTFVQMRRSFLARKLVVALWLFWIFRRSYRLGRRWLKVALELFDPAEPDELEQELLVASGLLELYAGNRPAARSRSAAGARPGLAGTQDEWRGASLATLGLLAATGGEHDRAIGLYRIFLESTEARKTFSPWLPTLRAVIRLALSGAHFARGEIDEAEYHATVALRNGLRLGDPLVVGYARIHLAAIAVERGNWLDSVDTYRDAIPLLLDRPHAGGAAMGFLGLAQLALRIEAYAVAARLIGIARLLLDAGTPPPPQLIRFDPDQLLVALQQLPRKQMPKAQSVEPIEQMSDLVEIVEQAFADLTDRLAPAVSAPGRNGPAGLTSRELEVLCLMADDLSAREIADALFIGVRTAETHVGNVIGKLGAKSRVGAVARALREGWCT